MSEEYFNFQKHCQECGSLVFFDQFTYLDFLQDVIENTNRFIFLDTKLNYAINERDPYLFLVKLFTHFLMKKRSVLISHKEKDYFLNILNSQIHFIFSEKTSEIFRKEIDFNVNLNKSEIVFFTTGSTNTPKGVLHNLNNLKRSASTFIDFFNSQPSETYFLNLPIHHVGGLMLCLRAFFSGGNIITQFREETKIDYISLVPTQLETYIRKNDHFLEFLKNTKAVLVGGAKLPPKLKKELSYLNIFETYGMTETASFISLNAKALPFKKLRLDSDGHILIKSDSLFLGYFENNQFSPPKKILINNEWYFKTNDLGEKNQNGEIVFTKRSDQVVNSGGEKISLAPIRKLILSIEGITQFHLTSFIDLKWGESIILFYESEHNLTDAILSYLKMNLHPYAVPKTIIRCSFQTTSGIKIRHLDFYEIYIKNIFEYRYIAKNDEDKRPLLVALHGFMENFNDWEFLERTFQSQYRILFINLPGHGNTSTKSFHHLEDVLNKLNSLINYFSNSNTHIIGYSMGGRVALELSKLTKIKSLTLISSGLGLNSFDECKKRVLADQNLLTNTSNLMEFFNTWYNNPIFGHFKKDDQYELLLKNKISTANPEEWQNSLNFFSPGFFPLKEINLNFLKNAEFKVNYIYGLEDKKYAAESDLIDAKYFNKHCIVNAFHNFHKTHQAQLIDLLISVFKS